MSANTSGLHEWASSYTGQNKAVGAVVVAVVVFMVLPSTRRYGFWALLGIFVLGVVVNLIHPGTFNGARTGGGN